MGRSEVGRLKRHDCCEPLRGRTYRAPENPDHRCAVGQRRGAALQGGEVVRSGGPSVSVAQQERSAVCEQHSVQTHQASGAEVGHPLGQLAGASSLARDVAEDGRCRPQGRAGADATLTGIDDGGHLPAVCTGVSAAGGELFDGTAYQRSDSVNYWSHFGAIGDFRGLQVIDFVVPGARIAPWCH